jgi:hypothetical protein
MGLAIYVFVYFGSFYFRFPSECIHCKNAPINFYDLLEI